MVPWYPEMGLDHHSIHLVQHPQLQPPLLMPFEWLTTRSTPLETRRHLHHYSCASNRSLHPHCSNRPSPVQKPHRTTARRGHTPAAHGQSSPSPSLLSLACSLQHKLTPRQRRARINTRTHKRKRTLKNTTSSSTHFIRDIKPIKCKKRPTPCKNIIKKSTTRKSKTKVNKQKETKQCKNTKIEPCTQAAPVCKHPSPTVGPRKQLYAWRACKFVWDAF
ncbi:hypothetical protein ECC02_006692 [Trypanosoma cruzi]|uniref:Uncharacterized protein n=1 Tax=Trypanosoma cruzi TaxID=5693 RepID=A0A7J6Y299_TRYCR|nr:hypothetical protein ECC02_006692 [Trypanosoma cruzi]